MFGKGRRIKRDDISQESLLAFYFDVYHLPCLIKSPFREDNNPSFSFYMTQNGNIRYNDFASGEKGTLIEAIAKLKDVRIENVWPLIREDFSSPEYTENSRIDRVITTRVEQRKDFRIKIRPWQPYDIDYWASFGVNLAFLSKMEVYPISHVFVDFKGILWPFACDKYAYAYVERKEGFVSYKIYQPFNKKGRKWQTNMDKTTIGLWTKLPEKGDRVCICSSYKDAMSLWANTGIPAVAIQAEGFSISEHAQKDLRDRFTDVIIILDNDEPGLKYAESLAKATGFRNVTLPQFDGGKDISDLYKHLDNKEKFRQTIFGLL